VFSVCSSKTCSFDRHASAANDVNIDVDVFGTKTIFLNRFYNLYVLIVKTLMAFSIIYHHISSHGIVVGMITPIEWF
jgi:hypothetical protein